MEFHYSRMRLPLSMLARRWAQPVVQPMVQPMARRCIGIETAKRNSRQKRTAIVTGSSRGMYLRLYPKSQTQVLVLT
jgi:hypothetical protein